MLSVLPMEVLRRLSEYDRQIHRRLARFLIGETLCMFSFNRQIERKGCTTRL